jgi:CTP synthase
VSAKAAPDLTINLAMVGKYVNLKDAYISLNEALTHAGLRTRTRVNVDFVEATDIERHGPGALAGMDAILVPGGFGERGIEGKIAAARYARENDVPYLGLCLGLQVAVIEFARNVAGLDGAHSSEFDRATPHPVIALITEWADRQGGTERRTEGSNLGGTMRLGAQECRLEPGSLAHTVYGSELIMERHRHRYEFNNRYMERLARFGLSFTGRSVDGLVEMIELPSNTWFLASQFHPEFTSTPRDGHPLFSGFIKAARAQRTEQLPRAVQA